MAPRLGLTSRRSLLLGAAGLAVAGCAGPRGEAQPGTQSTSVTSTSAAAPVEPVVTERVRSASRGTEVQLITMRPSGIGGRLPVCLAMHGRGSDANMFVDLGVPEMLTSMANGGTLPFAVVSVDGGDDYWIAKKSSDDPQAMLNTELPVWLTNRGLASTPIAVLGISMGGYGALNYARGQSGITVAAISPALFLSWPEAESKDAFADEAQWQATDPLQHLNELSSKDIGVWCGTEDPFIDSTNKLVESVQPKIAAIGDGGHDEPYWRKVLPAALDFVVSSLSQ